MDWKRRFRFVAAPSAGATPNLRECVAAGLAATPKRLPCIFFYDEAGSDLFDAICDLPEYYLTRAEDEILCTSREEILEAAGRPRDVVELGCGSARKTQKLLEAAIAYGDVRFLPIDISEHALAEASENLLKRLQRLFVHAIAGEFQDGLRVLPPSQGPRLFLFMGSNIGNLEHEEAAGFLGAIRGQMRVHDRLLLGADLVKEPAVLIAAYNDSAGVTERFNKNVLRRINTELGGEFDLDSFEHRAPWVAERSRIEMHLVSRLPQRVPIRELNAAFGFEAGETIWTESCHKYTEESLSELARKGGLRVQKTWFDSDRRFSVLLLAPDAGGTVSS